MMKVNLKTLEESITELEARQLLICRIPNYRQWYAKWKLRWNTYTLHMHFCTFDADLYTLS